MTHMTHITQLTHVSQSGYSLSMSPQLPKNWKARDYRDEDLNIHFEPHVFEGFVSAMGTNYCIRCDRLIGDSSHCKAEELDEKYEEWYAESERHETRKVESDAASFAVIRGYYPAEYRGRRLPEEMFVERRKLGDPTEWPKEGWRIVLPPGSPLPKVHPLLPIGCNDARTMPPGWVESQIAKAMRGGGTDSDAGKSPAPARTRDRKERTEKAQDRGSGEIRLRLEDDLLARVDDFRFSGRFESRNAAMKWLLECGLRHVDEK